MSKESRTIRYAEVDRETKKTSVRIVLNLDGGDRRDISTGIGFLDQVLEHMAFAGMLDLGVQVDGDWGVDDHLSAEEVGICLGKAIREALGSTSVEGLASLDSVMDDALVSVSMDICGRGQLYWDVPFERENIGRLATQSVRVLLSAICQHAGLALHVRKLAGHNDQHVCEALFRGLGVVLHRATRPSERRTANAKTTVG